MIDAYEVGIQLALQDGVSAGLEVIGRELAEVDRAITASNAGLIALTRTAENAVRAVAAASSGRSPVPVMPSNQPVSVGESSTTTRDLAEQPPPISAPAAPAGATAPNAVGALPKVERSEPGSPPEMAVQAMSAGSPTSPPVTSRGNGQPANVAVPQSALSLPAAAPLPSVPPDLKSTPTSTSAPAVAAPQSEPVPQTLVVTPVVPRSPQVTSPGARPPIPMQASVGQAVGPNVSRQAAIRQSDAAGGASFNLPVTVVQTPTAPAAAGPRGPTAPARGSSSLERAAAPQPQSRDSGEGTSGSVMLDGRLVGYWLTEQMAREAARPPGGTSFFDPRQTPAWTPSGAL